MRIREEVGMGRKAEEGEKVREERVDREVKGGKGKEGVRKGEGKAK